MVKLGRELGREYEPEINDTYTKTSARKLRKELGQTKTHRITRIKVRTGGHGIQTWWRLTER